MSKVLGVGVPFEWQLFGKVESVFGHVRRPFAGPQDSFTGSDAPGSFAAKALVGLFGVDLVGRKQNLVAPFLDQRRSQLVQTWHVTVVRFGFRVFELLDFGVIFAVFPKSILQFCMAVSNIGTIAGSLAIEKFSGLVRVWVQKLHRDLR